MSLLKCIGLALCSLMCTALLLTILAVGVAIIEWVFGQYAIIVFALLAVLGLLTFIFYMTQDDDRRD